SFQVSGIGPSSDGGIGGVEDKQPGTLGPAAGQTFDAAQPNVPEDRRKMAMEELLIAEGSDWCWWYGPEHDSANRPEFDQLYRSHLANVYRFLNLTPPEELSRPILRIAVQAIEIPPSSPISPTIDGEVTSYFEWMGAGIYRAEERWGAMHGKKFLIDEVQYGSDGANLYVRVDFHEEFAKSITAMELRLTSLAVDSGETRHLTVSFTPAGATSRGIEGTECGFSR